MRLNRNNTCNKTLNYFEEKVEANMQKDGSYHGIKDKFVWADLKDIFLEGIHEQFFKYEIFIQSQ